MKSLLIIDDDVKLATMLREYLERQEVRLEMRHNGEMGLEAVKTGQFDLILLDVMLPDLDGFEVLRRLRAFSDLAVILLTARGEAADRVRGLELGADDYLSKPFNPAELVARIRAILRRSGQYSAQAANRRLSLGDLELDLTSHTAKYKSAPLELTTIELSLLEAFVQAPGVVLTREDLVVRVFERPFHPLNRSLDMHVCRLRKKLLSATLLGDPIKTIRSSGYLFSASDL